MAHAMCFDRVANLAARQAGTITGPKYRMASLRGPASRYVAREVDGTASYFDLGADPLGVVDVRGTVSASPEGGELLSLLQDRSNALFTGSDTSRSAVDLDEEERLRLEALGYMEQ